MTIKFIPLEPSHLAYLRRWLKEPHVAEFWQESEDENEFREKFLTKLAARHISPYLIEYKGQLIGYIQSYEPSQIGGGWWPDAPPGAYGIDQFIGEPSMINRGIGTEVIRTFIQALLASPKVNQIWADPEPGNHRAIHVYQKLGFRSKGVVKTPNGEAMLMVYQR